jgi:negative regulator of sigma E activity
MRRSPRLRRAFLTLLALIALPLAAAQSPAEALFVRMLRAEQGHAFVGELREEVRWPEPLRGAAERFRHPPGVTPELVASNFELAISGRERVAGREALLLTLVPHNGFSPNWTFWIDERSGLRLAYEQRDAEGSLLAEGRYLSVERIRDLDTPRRLAAPSSDIEVKRLAERLLPADAMPEGFVPVALERTSLGDSDIRALRLTLWDGLNGTVLLIYPRQRQVEDRPYLVSRSLRQVTVTALGPLPQRALQGWLDRVTDGPVRRLDGGQLDRFDLGGDER